jgi:hypothetical protein
MKSFVLVFLVVGIVMLSVGYQRKLAKNIEIVKEKEVVFIPRSIYEDQFGPQKLESSFADMFEKQDVFFKVV